MSRSRVDLDRIAVASPCPMNWSDMIGDERVRFCNQCNLNVYNISAMTKLEAESFIANAEGRICARLYRRADGTVLTQNCPVGLRAVRKKVSRAAATAFSALISLFGGSAIFAQQQPKNEKNVDIQRTLRREGQVAIKGTVFDRNHAVIPGPQIKLINERTKREVTTRANDVGEFRFSDLEKGVYTLEVSARGFIKMSRVGIEVSDEQSLNLDVALEVGGDNIGVIVVDERHSGKLKRKGRPRE
jgi:carboxypeptidase family protein